MPTLSENVKSKPLRKPNWRHLAVGSLMLIFLSVSSCSAVYGEEALNPSAAVMDTTFVTFSVDEAVDIRNLLDEQELDIQLLRINLRAAHEMAEVDSMMAEVKLDAFKAHYESVIAAYKNSRPTWVERLLLRPEIWMMAGVWLGTQASR